MVKSPTSFTVVADPEGDRLNPEDISNMGGDDVVGFLSGVAESYRYESAGQTYAYNIRLEDADNDNLKKLEGLGYKPRHVFDITRTPTSMFEPSGYHEASTFFQGLMNGQAPVPGIDERYRADTEFKRQLQADISYNEQLISTAITEHPDAGIRTYRELHKGVLDSIAKDRTMDPRGGWGQALGGVIGGMASIFNLRSNPYVIPEVGALVFGGVGPKVGYRLLSLAAVNAAANVIPKLGSQTTLQMAGVPLTNRDLVVAGGLGALFGLGGGALGEALIGRAGRAALNERYSWMSVSKRQARYQGRPAPDIPEVPPLIPGAPSPPTAIPSGLPAVIRGMEGQPVPSLPGLPPRPPPTKLPALLEQQIPVPTQAPGAISGAPVVYASKGQRVALGILDRAETQAAKVRKAIDLDHAAKQMDIPGMMPQDIIPPSRALGPNATIMPDVRVWGGPGAGEIPKLPSIWERAARGHDFTPESLARELDEEIWGRWDRTSKALREGEKNLQTAIKFHEEARAGVTTTLDQHINELQASFERARTAESKTRIAQDIQDALKHHEDLKTTKAGGEGPPPPPGLNILTHAEHVAELEARRDEIFQDVERSIARAQGRWGLKNAEREALEEQLRPGAVDRINSPWRWPKGTKRKAREKGKIKGPYEISVLKGPTQEELFAAHKADVPQLTDPRAAEVTKPGDTPQQIATKVNELAKKQIDEVDADAFFKNANEFVKQMEEATTPGKPGITAIPKPSQTTRIPKAGETEPIPKPSLSAGMTWEQLMREGKFEVDGKSVSLKQALEDVHGEEEAFKIFNSCAKVP